MAKFVLGCRGEGNDCFLSLFSTSETRVLQGFLVVFLIVIGAKWEHLQIVLSKLSTFVSRLEEQVPPLASHTLHCGRYDSSLKRRRPLMKLHQRGSRTSAIAPLAKRKGGEEGSSTDIGVVRKNGRVGLVQSTASTWTGRVTLLEGAGEGRGTEEMKEGAMRCR